MNSASSEDGDGASHPTVARPLPAFVDWLLAALIAIAGLGSLLGGTVLTFVVDRSLLAEAISRGDRSGMPLTDAEFLDLAAAVETWLGVGLLVTGLGMVVGAIAYAVVRHRAHLDAADGEPAGSFVANAVLGAVTTAVLGFLPFSPAVGGAIAGYLERGVSERTVSVGAASGLLAAAPLLVLMVFLLGGLVSGLLAIGDGGLAIVAGAAVLLGMALAATVSGGLGAIGGYVGGALAGS